MQYILKWFQFTTVANVQLSIDALNSRLFRSAQAAALLIDEGPKKALLDRARMLLPPQVVRGRAVS